MDFRPGMEVTPVLSYNEDGSEYVSEFAIDAFERGTEINTAEYAQIPDGPEQYEDADTDAQYVADLMQLNPEIPDALEWAHQTQSEEWIDQYNAAIDSDDYGQLNAAIEELLSLYANAEEYEPEEVDDSEEEPLEEEEQEYAAEIIEELTSAEPSFVESLEMDELAEEALQAGNPCLADAAMLSAMFHREEISAEDALEHLFKNYSNAELQQVAEYLEL